MLQLHSKPKKVSRATSQIDKFNHRIAQKKDKLNCK
jgi:hypothetical protein